MAMSHTEGNIGSPPELSATATETITLSAARANTIDDETSTTGDDLSIPSTSAVIVNGEVPPPDPTNLTSSQKEEHVTDDDVVTSMTPLPLSKISLDKVDFIRGPHNRVKLYVLCDQRVWDDRGTGHVACLPAADDSGSWCIIVRLEANEKNVLESRIMLDTIYQKQQGTLIVWSESDSCDLALSFQEKTGCTEIWDKICRIQGKDPDAEDENECDEQEPSDSSTSGISSGVCASSILLPSCDLEHLPELKALLAEGILNSNQREKMANAIQQNGYIAKLCDIFQMCEDLEDTEKLKLLYSIAKNLFLLNSNLLLNDLLDENYFKDIVGMLEYDPAFPELRKHREFLWEKSKFRQVLPIKSEELKAKIHQTYRVQYVLDVCLPAPSLFEENLLTVLSSHLFFNRAEIVNALINDKDLMKRLFEELKDPKIPPKRQRDLTNFLKELCSFAHSLQPAVRDQFFKTLMTNDVLATIDPCISSSLSTTRAATVELLTMIVDFNPQIFRDYLVKQFRIIPETKNDDLLINKLINHMLSDKDPEQTAANQMSQALRILLDPESIVAKGEKTEFLPIFYKRAMYSLCKPIYENAKDGSPIRDDYYTANRLSLVIDLFCFFVDHHNYSMRSYIIKKNLLLAVLVYLKSSHHLLALSALRMCRRILYLKDELYFRYICDRKIIDEIVNCFVSNGPWYNLLNSALIEFFEFVRSDEIRPLIEYVIENFWDVFSKVDYVRTFSAMKLRYDQFNYRKNSSNSTSNGGKSAEKDEEDRRLSASPNNAQWKKEKEYDNDELFFSKDDDENWYKPDNGNENAKVSSGTDLDNVENLPQRKSGVEPLFPSVSRKRRANDDDEVASIFGGNITPPITSTFQSRISKIMICVNSANENKSLGIIQRSPILPNSTNNIDNEGSNSENNKDNYDDDGESVVSSSSSSPPKFASSTTTVSDLPAKNFVGIDEAARIFEHIGGDKERFFPSFTNVVAHTNSNSTKNGKDPIILKKGLSGLVDYDESDEDSDDEESASLLNEKHKRYSDHKVNFISNDPSTLVNNKDECNSSESSSNGGDGSNGKGNGSNYNDEDQYITSNNISSKKCINIINKHSALAGNETNNHIHSGSSNDESLNTTVVDQQSL